MYSRRPAANKWVRVLGVAVVILVGAYVGSQIARGILGLLNVVSRGMINDSVMVAGGVLGAGLVLYYFYRNRHRFHWD